MNEYLNNLVKMISKIKRIKKDNIKFEYIDQIITYASFAYYSGYISNEEFTMIIDRIDGDPFEKTYRSERDLSIKNLIINNDLLHGFYDKCLSYYWNYQLPKKKNLNIKVDFRKHFIEFLKYMNCYDLYQELESKKMISFSSPVLNHSICISNKKDSYIIINEEEGIDRYLALSHEIAHAFENRILNKRKKYFDTPYTTEILPITFTRIFIEYLKMNNVLSKEEITIVQNNFEIDCFSFLKWSYLITEAIKYNAYVINDYDINIRMKDYTIIRNLTDHNYSLGSLISLSLLDMWQKNGQAFINSLPQIVFLLDKMNLNELIEFFNKHNCLNQELGKILIKK